MTAALHESPPKTAISLLTAFFLLVSFTVVGQVRLTGTVKDAQGNGIPGITVAVKNTSFATATDVNGAYTLNAGLQPGRYTVHFSGVGFRAAEEPLQVTAAAADYVLGASLERTSKDLDEVIVTGTTQGTTRKQLGSYVSTVSASDLNKGVAANALQALQGKTAGAQIVQNNGDPAGGISVRLRGISSISSSSEPLYIVDGVIVNNATNRVTNTASGYDGNNFVGTIGQNRMTDINPADIDRIEVLNGAAAAAIYGSRANAGVIQIFTKRGKTGAPQINFSTNFMVSKLRKSVPVNQSPVKFGGSPDVFTQDIISAIGTPAALPTNTTDVTRYDYNDYIFRTATGTDNNLSVSGGNDLTKYYVSASYFKNQGIIKNTDYQRYSLRANLDQTINKWISFTAGINYVNSAANEKPDGNSFFSPMNSINIIGNFHNIWERDALGNLKAVGERGRVNPVSIIEDFKQRQQTSRVLASAGIKLKPTKNLTINYTIGVDNYAQTGTTFIPPYAYNVNSAFWGGNDSLNGYVSAASNSFYQINHDLTANYEARINDDLISVTQVGYSLQYEKNHYIMAQGRGLAPVVQTVVGASTILTPADSRSEMSISGAYLQQTFRIANKLFLTGAVRMDGSSVFGKDQRNQIYTKLSGSYVLSDAKFWNIDSWNLLKLRAAYGQSGNMTGIGAYDRFNSYSTNSYLGKTALVSSTQQANVNVKPERQDEVEFGTDMAFLNSRINFTFNYYIKKVSDLLISRTTAPTTGFNSLLDNFGSLENKGFEIVINATPVRNKDFAWDLTAIYNHNRNKAVKIGQALTLLSTNAGAPVAIIEGQPIGVFYGTFFARDNSGAEVKTATGIPLIEKGVQNGVLEYTPQRDANGVPSGTTLRKVLGNPNPKYTASLVNEFSYKRLGLRVQLDAVQGVDVWNADWRTRQGVGNGKVAEQEQMGLLPRGYISGVYAIEEWRIDDGSFVKLREISLSYNTGPIGKAFKGLTISASGRNLISWDHYKGYDPEVNSGGQSTILRGIDFGSVPIPASFSVGVSAKF